MSMVITSTNRLAREHHEQFDREHQEKGLRSWSTAPVKTLNAWMFDLWEEIMYSQPDQSLRRPLRPMEEQIIWEKIIRSKAKGLVLDTSATAELAWNSWKLLIEWCLPLEGVDWMTSEDTRTFRQWALEFRAQCDQKGWFSEAELPFQIAQFIGTGQVDLPDEVELIGFLDPTPVQKQFFETLQKYGTRIHQAPISDRSDQIVRFSASDTLQEIRTAAEWARHLMETDPEAALPSFRIAIIIPGLQKLRSHVERIFAEVFHPQSSLQPEKDPQRLFNLSLGLPASKHPIIQSALQILSIDPKELSLDEASHLIQSPFLPGFKQEHSSRSLLDVALRKRRELDVSMRRLIHLAGKEGTPHYCPILASVLHTWHQGIRDLKGRKIPSEWAECLTGLLQSAKSVVPTEEGTPSTQLISTGWPGNWHPPSIEYQTYEAWKDLISGLVELDGACGRISRQEAVAVLRRMASQKLFQPDSEPAPVQILGVLEASGLSFDYLWLLGMHDEGWPPPCEPAPFVPISLQRRYNLWRSTAEGMLANAQEIANGLKRSAPMVVVSHPLREGDADLRVSPMFASLPEASIRDLGLGKIRGLTERMRSSSDMEILQDHQGLPCTEQEISGGTNLFKLQAACPFQAFAKLRLGVIPLKTAEPGLDALDRGALIHEILNQIWQKLGTHSNLIALPKEEEVALIQQVVRETLEGRTSSRRALGNQNFAHIEQGRLEQIITQWLELEKERSPFTVLESEERQAVYVGGIAITIQEDRVDLLENGERLILDYKTGECTPSSWEGERPEEPQLPIYAVASGDEPIAGISFGSLKVGKLGFKGIVNQNLKIPGVKKSQKPLSEYIQDWNEVLLKLGMEFREGMAEVTPKSPPRTCLSCGLTTFCRIGSVAAQSRYRDES